MKEKQTRSLPAVGAGSLLTAFAVLCLTVFALLSIATVREEERLHEAAARAAEAYYLADFQAEEIFAQLRSGMLPEEVTVDGTFYTYACPISRHSMLQVALEQTASGWTVLKWQTVTEEIPAEGEKLPVWTGPEQEARP